ncbi:MAG: hypothetical protein WCF19_00015 [Chlamydiales bacterium]
MNRIFFCIVFFFLACALFNTQILGAAARIIMRKKTGCEMAYRSLYWKRGELIFSDVTFSGSFFYSHMEKVSFRPDWRSFPRKIKGHLTLNSPYLSITERIISPRMDSSWFDLSLSVKDGILDWDGPVRFSAEHTSSRSDLSLDWGDASALMIYQNGELQGDLKNFRLSLLQPWLPFGEIVEGRATGQMAIDDEGCPLKANLSVEQLKAAWPGGSVDRLAGSLSFNAQLGAKWKLDGLGQSQGKEFPFTSVGRAFFKKRWIESNIEFGDSWCKMGRDEGWNVECWQLKAEQVSWLQGGLALFCDEFGKGSILNGSVSGKASFAHSSWNAQFEGQNVTVQIGEALFACTKAKGDLTEEGGSFVLFSPAADLKFAGTWEDWNGEVRLGPIDLVLHGGWDGQKVPIQIGKGTLAALEFWGSGWIDPAFDLFFTLHGEWSLFEKKIPIHCPELSRQGGGWTFDFRAPRKMWDLFRLGGTVSQNEIAYHPKNHLLGVPLVFHPAPLGELDVSLELPWSALLSAGPFLKEWGLDLKKIPPVEKTFLHFQWRGGEADLTAHSDSLPFSLHVAQKGDAWKIDLDSDIALQAVVKKDGSAKGKGRWKSEVEVEFDGQITPAFHCEFSLPRVSADLKISQPLCMEGTIEGQGHFIYNGEIESDFDFTPSSLAIQSEPLENQGSIHLSYSSLRGALFTGVNLHGLFDCIVDLLEYDIQRSHWIFHKAQVHLPCSLLTSPFLRFLDKEKELNFTADLDVASDFSTFVCTLREGWIPCQGASLPIDDLALSWSHGKCAAALHYKGHLHQLQMQLDDRMTGRLTVGEEETPLCIDWEYRDAFLIQSIEGSFGGVEASFHAESPNQLVGSARVDFTALSPLLPLDVAQVFTEIKMGKGYELKGQLNIQNNRPSFRGLLSGKAVELFGFQFRTLLAQVDLHPESIQIFDVKISDSAGIMKIDQILLEGKEDKPWTIEIPHLTILEMRPSLMQRPGGLVGPISPLVVRELNIEDFKGLLDDGKTYTAKGDLHFINSYKRGETVFDLPANLLSRIVGLDLELLIPVTGDLTFNIKNGYFNLLELTNAYSEGRRSQFFLENTPPPRMDLDGNLEIFIKMKQFVLLKITESLLISIDGILDDPQIHLKKKRFFGLM